MSKAISKTMMVWLKVIVSVSCAYPLVWLAVTALHRAVEPIMSNMLWLSLIALAIVGVILLLFMYKDITSPENKEHWRNVDSQVAGVASSEINKPSDSSHSNAKTQNFHTALRIAKYLWNNW